MIFRFNKEGEVMNTERKQPLSGIRVLDLSTMLPGPFCTMILADFGADVIKVENPSGGDPTRYLNAGDPKSISPRFATLNRNKRGIALNLKHPAGREAFLRLVDQADVLVEQFRPGVMERLGLDYNTISSRNPRLIYCSITGYGQDGPYRELAGHDLNYIGYAGVLGLQKAPVPPGTQIADVAGGSLMACIGILLALQERNSSGQGQYIDTSMMDGSIGTLLVHLAEVLVGGKAPEPGQGRLAGGMPWYDVYRTADGRYVTLGAIEPKFWEAFCRAVEREDWIPLQSAGGEQLERLRSELEQLFASQTMAWWLEKMKDVDTCFGPVLYLDEVPEDPQVKARGLVTQGPAPGGGVINMLANPIRLSRTPWKVGSPAPYLGEHTTQVLREAGYTDEEIARLLEQGAAFQG